MVWGIVCRVQVYGVGVSAWGLGLGFGVQAVGYVRDEETEGRLPGWMDKQTDRWTNRQTDGQTDRQMDGEV